MSIPKSSSIINLLRTRYTSQTVRMGSEIYLEQRVWYMLLDYRGHICLLWIVYAFHNMLTKINFLNQGKSLLRQYLPNSMILKILVVFKSKILRRIFKSPQLRSTCSKFSANNSFVTYFPEINFCFQYFVFVTIYLFLGFKSGVSPWIYS